MFRKSNQENMFKPSLQLILGFSIFLLLLPGMSGCAKTRKQMGKWWERNIENPVKGFKDRQLIVTSNPPQADVFINDVYQGKTPLRLKFKVGMTDVFKGFTVSVQKKGYLPVRRTISYRTERVTFALIKKKK
ncbi:MAG: PEGA domain-containing protein [Nitrospinae bacterium]|nr:PEGA domain-containing protein [Nitrospinota bacterium]